jgi:uncharacterized repeat protein (TIGR01451 family)
MKTTQLLSTLVGVILTAFGFAGISSATDFAAPKSYPVGKSPSVIVIGDFNGDGWPDLAVGNAGSNDVSILLNNGDGTFKAAVNSPAGISPQNMVTGDFNADGKLDLVVSNSGDPGVFLLLGNGDGTFRVPAAITADQFPKSIAAADFNEDKKLDLLMDGALLLGNGDGTFQPRTEILGGDVTAVVIGDFNGDKHVDVLVGRREHSDTSNLTSLNLSLLAGNGDGTFQSATFIATVGSAQKNGSETVFSPYLDSGDFNGDGKLDVLLRYEMHVVPGCDTCDEYWRDQVAVFPGNGDGTFAPSVNVFSHFLFATTTGNISVGDFNADGKQDFVFSDLGAGHLELGHGDGSFLAPPPLWTALAQFVATADLNGDTLSDIAVTDLTNNAVIVFLNNCPTSGADLGLYLNQTPAATVVVGGGNFSYTATVLNEGPQDATGVALTEFLPSGLKLVSALPSQGACTGTTTITCALGAMTDVSAATVSFTVTPTAAGTLTDALHTVATTPDLNSTNDSASFTLTAEPPADLAVTQTASASSVVAGTQVTYTIMVKNNGPAQATNVLLNDGFTAGATIAALQTSQGSCAAPANGSMSCALGTLSASATATISFGATLSAAGMMTSAVGVSAAEPDLNTANNSASLDVTVTAPPDFSISPTTNSLVLQRGGSASDVLSFPVQGGFAGNIALTCAVTGPSPAPTCGILPASVTPGNTTTLTVSAANLTANFAPLHASGQLSAAIWPLWLPLSALGLVLATKSPKERRGLLLLCALIAVAGILPVACGGGSSSQSAPQTFTVTVTAAASPGGMHHTTLISVTVQ